MKSNTGTTKMTTDRWLNTVIQWKTIYPLKIKISIGNKLLRYLSKQSKSERKIQVLENNLSLFAWLGYKIDVWSKLNEKIQQWALIVELNYLRRMWEEEGRKNEGTFAYLFWGHT